MPRKPTTKQKVLARKTIDNYGSENPKSMGELLVETGYSENTAHNPQIITNSKGFQELMDEYIPDELLIKVELEGLGATRNDSVGQEVKDFSTRHKYLQTGLELKKVLQPKQDAPQTNNFYTQVIIQEAKQILKQKALDE